jgi:hypothetical protein
MSLLRVSLLSIVLAGAAFVGGVAVPTDARASVSIAVGYEALVKDADAVGIVTPVDAKSIWEEGRIYTYTHVKVDQGVAGELGTGGEGWVRTMGGVVGKIGQLVDGEPVLTVGKPSLLFMRKFKQGGTWEVSARAQGQYPVVVDDVAKTRKVIRSYSAGVLLPPKPAAPAPAQLGPLAPNDNAAAAAVTEKARLANEVLHDRPVDEVTRDIASTWKRLHPAPDSKK